MVKRMTSSSRPTAVAGERNAVCAAPGDTCAEPLQTRDPVAQRILLVLEACANQKRPLTMMELVEATALAKTTVHRMCWKLVELGLLEHCADGFSIGTKVFALANASPLISEVRLAAMPYLVELQRVAGASALTILSGGKALAIDGLYPRQPRFVPQIGASLPLHCTSFGKAIAANVDVELRDQLLGPGLLPAFTRRTIVHPVLIRRHLDRVAAEGLAYSYEEFRLGTISVAAAFKVHGGLVGSIGCVGASSNPIIRRSAPQVAAAAAGLQRALAEAERPA